MAHRKLMPFVAGDLLPVVDRHGHADAAGRADHGPRPLAQGTNMARKNRPNKGAVNRLTTL